MDAPLVEPVTASVPSDPLEALDTARILNETAAIPVLTSEQEQGLTQPAESASEEEVAPSGWNFLSIVSLVLALAVSPLAVVFGYLAVGQIRRSAQQGEALAWVAVALGWVWSVVYVVAGVVLALTWIQIA
jgi:ABC-type Fe3+ transport system permease subunit